MLVDLPAPSVFTYRCSVFPEVESGLANASRSAAATRTANCNTFRCMVLRVAVRWSGLLGGPVSGHSSAEEQIGQIGLPPESSRQILTKTLPWTRGPPLANAGTPAKLARIGGTAKSHSLAPPNACAQPPKRGRAARTVYATLSAAFWSAAADS